MFVRVFKFVEVSGSFLKGFRKLPETFHLNLHSDFSFLSDIGILLTPSHLDIAVYRLGLLRPS